MEDYSLKSLPLIALIFGVGIVVSSIMGEITADFKDTQTDESAFFGNQSLTWAGNNTAISFTSTPVSTGTVILYNNGTKVNKGNNYTVTSTTITITNYSAKEPEWLTDKLNASYHYTYPSAEKNMSNKGLKGQQNMSNWFPTIGLVLGAVIVIVALSGLFIFKKK